MEVDQPASKSRKSKLVSYISYPGHDDDQIDDEAIDDYDFHRESRNASEEDDDVKSTESGKNSPIPADFIVDSEKQMEIENKDQNESNEQKKSKLPPPPTAQCSAESQRIVNKMFESKIKRHLDVNKYIQSNKSFRNPSIYEKLIEYCNIDELGTNYPPVSQLSEILFCKE